MLAVYGINGHPGGWRSATTIGLLIGAVVLFAAFVAWEMRVEAPLMPLRLFLHRNLSTANGVGILWAGAMFAWFFISSQYLQFVLGYKPLKVGLAFLPGNLIMGALSIGISAKLVMRYGYRKPLAAGLLLAAVGLGLLARAPVHGHFLQDVLPSMILLGLGAGIAFNPVLLAAMGDVEPQEAGHCLRHRQHVVHDGRRARLRGARKHRVVPHLESADRRALGEGGADRRLPRRVPRRHDLCRPGCRSRRGAAPRGESPRFAHDERHGVEPVFDVD